MASRETAEELAAAVRAGLDVDPARDGIVIQSADGSIVAANPMAETILGLSIHEMAGRTSSDPRWAGSDENGSALRGDDHPSMRSLATGKAVRGSILGVYRSAKDSVAEHVWLLVDCAPVDFRDGKPTAVVSCFRPLLGARAAELRSAHTERLHHFLIESGPDIAAWQLADTTFLWVSSAIRHVLGYDPEELVGRLAVDLMHPDDAVVVRAAQAADWHHSTALMHVVRMRHRDGRYVALEVRRQVLRHADGTAAQLRTAWRDVSARVKAEQARDRALEQLLTVMTSSPIGIALCDSKGQMQLANPALGAMLGELPGDLTGRTLDEFLTVPGHFIEAGTVGDQPQQSEHEYRRKDGTTLWGWCTAVRVPHVVDDSPQILLHLVDITERRQRDEALRRAALHDPLTGLMNRAGLEEAFNRARVSGPSRRVHGLIFIDIDEFKQVNDVHGHDVGDQVLRGVADRIVRATREGDHAARVGGDEFVVFCPGADEGAMAQVAARLSEELARPYPATHRSVGISVSIGSAAAPADELSSLLAVADREMYRAKRSH
jgi:diguanylate cyclase (GGDEF)-like protein/PAS domain S-box-containing protein